MARAYVGGGTSSAINLSNADIEVSLDNQNSPKMRSSYRKLRMLPWCKDERDEIVHTEYIRFLAQMDSKSRSKATKHAIVAASSLLRAKRGVKEQKNRHYSRAQAA